MMRMRLPYCLRHMIALWKAHSPIWLECIHRPESRFGTQVYNGNQFQFVRYQPTMTTKWANRYQNVKLTKMPPLHRQTQKSTRTWYRNLNHFSTTLLNILVKTLPLWTMHCLLEITFSSITSITRKKRQKTTLQAFNIEHYINFRIPTWAQAVFPGGQLEKLTRFGYSLAAGTPTLARLRSGYLFKKILDSSTNKTAGTLVPNYSVNVYSAHDSTVANMLNLLGLYDENSPPPPYASTVFIEIRSVANKSLVEVFYKNSSAPPMAQYIPKCGYSCELTKMYTLYKDVLPTADFQTECKVKKSMFSKIKAWF